MKKVLITGVTGFVGSHLADHLLALGGYEVHGLKRCRMRELVDAVRPDWIFHLAAQSYVPASWREPDATLTCNIRGQVNLFEAVLAAGLSCRIQIAGSSEEYGLVGPDEVPITEDNPLRPLSPYAVSKVTQDMLAWQYHRSHGLDVVRTRGFNHTGPRRGEVFVASDFARQVARIEAGLQEPVIRVGNLEASRDFTDVRDMVRAYRLALESGVGGEVYNICSGTAITIRDMLDRLLALSPARIGVEQDPERMRPSDVMILLGSAARFRAVTGWSPEIPFARTLADLLDYWRARSGATT
jgi:GDP-4-dehydro-6-deoxy-D-mannose reductase